MDLSDTHVLVTGGSKGVGAALVCELVSRSARVTVAARPSAELEKIVARTGVNSAPIDLSDFAALDGYVARVENRHGHVDVLVNNAALVVAGTIGVLTREDLHQQINANLLAPMELCRQALPAMAERGGGAVVNVSSMVAELSIPNLSAYVAAKAGLTKFTTDLQGDLRRSGSPVRAILVVLGEVPRTQINAGFRTDEAVAKLADRFGKFPTLTPEEVARELCRALSKDKPDVMVLPKYNAPIFGLRQIPLSLTRGLIQ